MNAKGRVKEDGAFQFYEQEYSRRGISYHARRTNLIREKQNRRPL